MKGLRLPQIAGPAAWLICLLCTVSALAQAPEGRGPITPRDRVYVADQTSNTVSVIDPAANQLLGVIKLGDPRPNVLSPLYKGELNVHGLGFSPDHRTLAVISTGSNTVTLIDTATNTVKGTIYVGRSPHEGFFTPDGKELWVVVRGEDYLSVIDPVQRRETRRVKTANGPGMVVFSPDGKYAYVCHSFTPEFDVVDVRRREVVKRLPVVSPFSPNLAVTSDGTEVWLTHKDVGKVTVIDARRLVVKYVIDTGAVTNHVNFARTPQGRLAYITVGGEDRVKVYRTGTSAPEQVATITTGALPHGLWPSDDGSRMYVALENGDAVDVIDTQQQQVIATIKSGQMPQALVFVSHAAPDASAPNLMPLERAVENIQLKFRPPELSSGPTRASVPDRPPQPGLWGFGVIRPLGLIDSLEVNLSGLEPEQTYQLALDEGGGGARVGQLLPLTLLKADNKGKAVGQALGPLRQIVEGELPPDRSPRQRRLVLRRAGSGEIVLESNLESH